MPHRLTTAQLRGVVFPFLKEVSTCRSGAVPNIDSEVLRENWTIVSRLSRSVGPRRFPFQVSEHRRREAVEAAYSALRQEVEWLTPVLADLEREAAWAD